VLAAVDRLRYLGQNTNTTGGLKVARLEVFDPSLQRPNVERIIVLITDGVPTYDADKLDDEVAAVKRMGIRIVGLGVTNKVNPHISFRISTITVSFPVLCWMSFALVQWYSIELVMPWFQLRFDYDTTTIRLRRIARACFHSTQKMNMSIFRRSRIVVVSQSKRTHIVISITFVV